MRDGESEEASEEAAIAYEERKEGGNRGNMTCGQEKRGWGRRMG